MKRRKAKSSHTSADDIREQLVDERDTEWSFTELMKNLGKEKTTATTTKTITTTTATSNTKTASSSKKDDASASEAPNDLYSEFANEEDESADDLIQYSDDECDDHENFPSTRRKSMKRKWSDDDDEY